MSKPPRKRMQFRRRYLLLYILLLVATLVVMASLRTCGEDDLKGGGRQYEKGDTITVAIIYSPLSYYTYNDTLGGLNYDMLRRMSKDLNRPVKFVPVVSIDRSLKSLRDGGCDLFASLPVTAEMKHDYLFTEGVYTDRQVLIQRKLPDGSLRAKSVLDLADDTIHIEKNSAARERLENMAQEIGAEVVITSHEDLSDEYLFLKVLNGDFRYAVINGKMAAKMIEKHPEVSADTQIGFTQFQAWLTRRRDVKLLETVDKWLSDFKQTEEYEELLRRYSSKDTITIIEKR